MSKRLRLTAVIQGTVQGVGFRWAIRARANELRLTGYAANRANGTVEVQAEGDPSDLDALERFLRSGPRGAEVTQVDVRRGPATGEFSRFGTK